MQVGDYVKNNLGVNLGRISDIRQKTVVVINGHEYDPEDLEVVEAPQTAEPDSE